MAHGMTEGSKDYNHLDSGVTLTKGDFFDAPVVNQFQNRSSIFSKPLPINQNNSDQDDEKELEDQCIELVSSLFQNFNLECNESPPKANPSIFASDQHIRAY